MTPDAASTAALRGPSRPSQQAVQTRELLDNLATECGASLLLAGAAAQLAAGAIGPGPAAAFVCIAGALALARWILARRSAQAPAQLPAPAPVLLTALLGLSGLAWGALAASLLAAGSPSAAAVLIASIAAVSIAVAACRGQLAPSLSSAGTALGIPALFLLGQGRQDAVTLGAAVLLFAGSLWLLGREYRRQFAALLELERDRDSLLKVLRLREEELRRLSVGMKAHAEKHDALASSLRAREGEVGELSSRVDELSQTLQRVSPIDQQSGLLNDEHFHERILTEWARMLREEKPITLVWIDLDAVESFADTYGEQAWRDCVARIGRIVDRAGRRAGDCGGRLAPGRFALLLPGAGPRSAYQIADSVRRHIESLALPNAGATVHAVVTASVGVGTLLPTRQLQCDELLKRADSALYEAQFRGGNKTIQYRSMSGMRLERWDRHRDGEVTGQGLVRKLTVWGYKPNKQVLKPGTCLDDRRVTDDIVDAVVQGRLKVNVDGQSEILHPGDCLFIPKGLLTSAEVVGDVPVICIEGVKAA